MKSLRIATTIALIAGLAWIGPSETYASNPYPNYIDGNAGDPSITVRAFNWRSLEEQTYRWWKQSTIDDYILEDTPLPVNYDGEYNVVVKKNGVWKLNLPWPETLFPDTIFNESPWGAWYYFYYPDYDWGIWVNSVGWLYLCYRRYRIGCR